MSAINNIGESIKSSEISKTPVSPFAATGGTITYTDSNGLNPRSSPAYPGGYTVHTFTSNGTFTPNRAGNVEYLVVGGGGGASGGQASVNYGAGGAGGTVTYSASYSVSDTTSVTIGVG